MASADPFAVFADPSVSSISRSRALAILRGTDTNRDLPRPDPEDIWNGFLQHGPRLIASADFEWMAIDLTYLLLSTQYKEQFTDDQAQQAKAVLLAFKDRIEASGQFFCMSSSEWSWTNSVISTLVSLMRVYFSSRLAEFESFTQSFHSIHEYCCIFRYFRFLGDSISVSPEVRSALMALSDKFRDSYDEYPVAAADAAKVFLDPSVDGRIRRFALKKAVELIEGATSKSDKLASNKLAQELMPHLVTLTKESFFGWILVEYWSVAGYVLDTYVPAKGQITEEDILWMLELLPIACNLHPDAYNYASYKFKVSAVIKLVKANFDTDSPVVLEAYEKCWSAWISGNMGSMTISIISDVISNAPSFWKSKVPSVLELILAGSLESTLELTLSGQITMLGTTEPSALYPHLKLIGENISNLSILNIFNLVANSPSEMWAASGIDGMKLIDSLGAVQVMFIPNITRVIGMLVTAHPEQYSDMAVVRKIDDRIKSTSTFYFAFNIYGTLGLHSPKIRPEIVQLLMEWLRKPLQDYEKLAVLTNLKPIAEADVDMVKPYQKEIEAVRDASAGSTRESAQALCDTLDGISLRSLAAKIVNLDGIWKQIGLDANDPFLNAVAESQTQAGNEAAQQYDVLLSYNRDSHHAFEAADKIRAALVEKGFVVAMDAPRDKLDYKRVAKHIMNSQVVCPCLSRDYEESESCKRELGFAADQVRLGKKIVPIRLEDAAFTWTALITSGLLYTMFSDRELDDQTKLEEAALNLVKEVAAALGKPLPGAHESTAAGDVYKSLGFNSGDPLLQEIDKLKQSQGTKVYDVMLSYNWAHQSTVLRIKEWLEGRNVSVWMDTDQMSGNIYTKMAEAVMGSKVICACLTAQYEKSANCKRELGFAGDQVRNGKKIIPLRLDDTELTWSALITAGLRTIKVEDEHLKSDSQWDIVMQSLLDEILVALGAAAAPASVPAVPSTSASSAPDQVAPAATQTGAETAAPAKTHHHAPVRTTTFGQLDPVGAAQDVGASPEGYVPLKDFEALRERVRTLEMLVTRQTALLEKLILSRR
ncbi:uncharacterized protein BJ171DRAFT_532109 [Polychytrium aggregatum]|uniref:uncharacterized protein n=1 Tax=Polychytrium aggregatum TaxID=110093 RepID=UPI0022FDDD19|nr:uncharacterized protein BJ171DRAFT_532109 [Polychytrium aggregatum]KAI9193199.1 hypothetical protein BJ171DRAFT_532109 [Polychytrium aggregatum]